MAFRKFAKVQSVGFATNDGEGFTRLARAASSESESGSPNPSISPSYYIDGVKKIDVRATLEKVADKFAISANPADYIFEAIRANTTNIPNENHDGFHKSELLRFDLQAGMPVYETYKEKGHFVNHKAEAPKRARGVIVDAHYYADTPALDQCPSCDFDTKQASSRDATGIHCKRCAYPVKDEFVEILVAVDTKKDSAFANAVKSGALNAGSMGCSCQNTTCNVCSHVAHSVSDFCDHIRRGNKGTYWIKDAQGPNKGTWHKADKRTVNVELNKHGRRFIPEDFCSIVATDGFEVRKAFEYCNQVEFDEYSRVDQPADPKALQREILKAASLDVGDQSDMALETEALLLQAKLNAITARLEKRAQLEVDALAVMQPDGSVMELPEGARVIDEHDPENENSVRDMIPESQPGAPGHAPMTPGAPGIDGLSDQMSPDGELPQDQDQWTPESLGILPKADLDEDMSMNADAETNIHPTASVQEHTPFMFNKDYGEFYTEVTAAGNATVISKAGALLTVSAGKELSTEDDRNAFGRTILSSILSNGIVDTALKYDGAFPPRFADILDAAIEDMQDHQMRPEVPSIHDKDDNMREDAGRPVLKGLPEPIEDDGILNMDMDRESSDSVIGDRIENFENDGPVSPESLSTVEDEDSDMREDERPEFSMSKSDTSGKGVSNMRGNAGAVGKSASAEFEDNDEEKEEKDVDHEDKKEAAATNPRIPATTPNGISEQWTGLDKGKHDVSKGRHLDVSNYPHPDRPATEQGHQHLATLEARYKKLNASRIASIQKEADERIASAESTIADRFVRALRIVAQREALNLEESPMKAALFEMLASEQIVGHDRETGEDLVVGPISHDLARHYAERSFQAGMAEEIEHLVTRAAELMKSDPAYIASAESDLRRQAAQIPTMTSKAQLGVEDADTAEANEMQRQASKGNFYFSPAPEVETGENGFGRQSELGSALRSGSSKTNQFLDLIRSGPN